MSAATEPRWYVLNSMHMATLCADKADAEDVARTCDMEWPRQGPHRAVQLVEAPKIHYPMAEPVAWMWRVADSDWQLESTCPPERPLAIVEPLYTGYMADAYIEAQQRLADLQDLMSKSGLAHRKAVQEAVREVREECAKEFDALADEAEADSDPSALVGLYRSKAASIRERGAPPVAPALCCDGGPQWGHAWDCPTLP